MTRRGYLPKKTLGKWVTVEFFDHFLHGDGENNEKSIHRISGYVEEHSPDSIKFSWWVCLDEGDEGANSESCQILQGTVLRWGYAEPKKWFKVR
jgi:hypothetical protein